MMLSSVEHNFGALSHSRINCKLNKGPCSFYTKRVNHCRCVNKPKKLRSVAYNRKKNKQEKNLTFNCEICTSVEFALFSISYTCHRAFLDSVVKDSIVSSGFAVTSQRSRSVTLLLLLKLGLLNMVALHVKLPVLIVIGANIRVYLMIG